VDGARWVGEIGFDWQMWTDGAFKINTCLLPFLFLLKNLKRSKHKLIRYQLRSRGLTRHLNKCLVNGCG
jgi:hypothetical protein